MYKYYDLTIILIFFKNSWLKAMNHLERSPTVTWPNIRIDRKKKKWTGLKDWTDIDEEMIPKIFSLNNKVVGATTDKNEDEGEGRLGRKIINIIWSTLHIYNSCHLLSTMDEAILPNFKAPF
jgi:hypothetical protein